MESVFKQAIIARAILVMRQVCAFALAFYAQRGSVLSEIIAAKQATCPLAGAVYLF